MRNLFKITPKQTQPESSYTSEQLLHEVFIKDRRFKFAQTVFLFLLVVGVGFGLFYSISTQHQNKQLLQQVSKVLENQSNIATTRHQQAVDINTNTNKEIEKLDAELQCFGKFFSNENVNRANQGIAGGDLTQCSIANVGSSGGTVSSVPKVPSNSDTSQTPAVVPNSSNVTPSKPTTPTTSEPPKPPQSKNPIVNLLNGFIKGL